MGEPQGTPVTLHPSRKLTQFQGHFPANSDHYCKSRSQLFQAAKPSIVNSKPYKCSKMMESVPLGVPVKKDIATCDIHNTIKKGIGLGDQDVPSTSSNNPGKGLKSRNPALRKDTLSYMNPRRKIPSLTQTLKGSWNQTAQSSQRNAGDHIRRTLRQGI
jgi:hypothetical protein